MKGIKGLLESRKATVLVIVLTVLSVLLYFGKIDGELYAMLVSGLTAVWKAAHSHEESNKAKAGARLIDQAATRALHVAATNKSTTAETE